jgi:hypothetical protein
VLGPARAVGVAALEAAGALAGQPVAAVGSSNDGPGPGGGLAGVALAVQLDHHIGTQSGVLLLAADPLVQLGWCPFSGREGARVERRKHRIQGRGGRLAGALAGGGDGALADRFGVGGWHAQAVAGEGLARRRPGGTELAGGGVDAAELLGELEGTLGLGPVGEEPAGLPAQRVAIVLAPPLRFALRLSAGTEADVEQYACIARRRLRPAA